MSLVFSLTVDQFEQACDSLSLYQQQNKLRVAEIEGFLMKMYVNIVRKGGNAGKPTKKFPFFHCNF